MLPVGNNIATNASTNVVTAYTPRMPDSDNDHVGVNKHHKPYANKREIILSCSHVFHAKCIANFERFLRATVRKHIKFMPKSGLNTYVVYELYLASYLIRRPTMVYLYYFYRKRECVRFAEANTRKRTFALRKMIFKLLLLERYFVDTLVNNNISNGS